jgi:hypothetical protein
MEHGSPDPELAGVIEVRVFEDKNRIDVEQSDPEDDDLDYEGKRRLERAAAAVRNGLDEEFHEMTVVGGSHLEETWSDTIPQV